MPYKILEIYVDAFFRERWRLWCEENKQGNSDLG
jgi:hypothetical protein